jgi:hypothetical protein
MEEQLTRLVEVQAEQLKLLRDLVERGEK